MLIPSARHRLTARAMPVLIFSEDILLSHRRVLPTFATIMVSSDRQRRTWQTILCLTWSNQWGNSRARIPQWANIGLIFALLEWNGSRVETECLRTYCIVDVPVHLLFRLVDCLIDNKIHDWLKYYALSVHILLRSRDTTVTVWFLAFPIPDWLIGWYSQTPLSVLGMIQNDTLQWRYGNRWVCY